MLRYILTQVGLDEARMSRDSGSLSLSTGINTILVRSWPQLIEWSKPSAIHSMQVKLKFLWQLGALAHWKRTDVQG